MEKDKHKDAIERFESYAEADRNNREDALDDLKHLSGDQWDDAVRQAREQSGRPVLTVNKLMQFVNQVAGDLRQTQPAIEPVPVDDETDVAMTEIMAGLIRQIEYQSNATSAYNWGAQCQISAGIGHWQVATEYADDTTFDQDIRIKRIVDPLSVIWDSASTEIDRSDASECFVTELMDKDKFKRIYGEKNLPDPFPKANTDGDSGTLRWNAREDEKIRIASHWYKVPTKKMIGLTQNGRVIDLSAYPPEALMQLGVIKTREVETWKIMHCLLSGSGYLDEPKEWAGKHIPVIPVIGNEIVVDGELIRHGIIRYAKDPQRLYNHFRSAAAEIIGTQPKAPWLVPQVSIEGLEAYWKRANVDNLPYLPYKIVPEAPNARPSREAPPQGSAAMYQEIQVAETDLYGTTGIYPTSLGGKSNEASGRAILARQKEADTGTYVYFDNFKASMRRTGEILLDLIPRVYDSTRIVRVLGADGQEKSAEVNMIVNDPFGGSAIVNDLSAAKFDIRIKTGTAYASAREQAREALTAIIQADPSLMRVFGDLYFENMDFNGAGALAARMKKTMPTQLVGEGGMEQPQNPMAERAAVAEVEKTEAEAADKAASAEGKQIDNAAKAYQFGAAAQEHATAEPTLQ